MLKERRRKGEERKGGREEREGVDGIGELEVEPRNYRAKGGLRKAKEI